MLLRESNLILAPTDIANHLACRHLTQLNRARAEGRLDVSPRRDPHVDALQYRGSIHEAAYVASLEAGGSGVSDLRNAHDASATLERMRDGVDVIVQAPLADARMSGRSDVLLRVATPSALGAYSYEPVDTKLARDTRAGTILQLCAYSLLLESMQGARPTSFHVVTPREREAYRTADFTAYFRLIYDLLEADLRMDPEPTTYPEPAPHCDVCSYWAHCDARRRADDHLSLVAGASRLNIRELQSMGVTTVTGLASCASALPEAPRRGALHTYQRLVDQARLQIEARTRATPPFERLAVEASRGLARLPPPSPGDVFLDFEGDPYCGDGGLEYLTGWAYRDESGAWAYRDAWALTRADEREACETFLDFVLARLELHPDLHVYHFGIYEPAALKRLVSRHATRAEVLDRLLRGGRLVDLHVVVREGFRVGVERYGLKELEPLVGFRRAHDLRDAGLARLRIELALEMDATAEIDAELRDRVEAYNREDCLSTVALRDWLEGRRAEAEPPIARPAPMSAEPSAAVKDRDQALQHAAEALLTDVPSDPTERDAEQQARWLLAQMVGYFRREEKCAWWEHYRLRGLTPEKLLDERDAVAKLRFTAELPKAPRQRVSIHRYSFPPQETALDAGDKLRSPTGEDEPFGTVGTIDLVAGTIDIRKTARTANVHPECVFQEQVVPAKSLEQALLSFAEHVVNAGLDSDGPYRAASDLLCRGLPRRGSTTGQSLREPGEDLAAAAVRLSRELDGGVLPIQGPPGSGKTHIGARMIVALARDGRRVGVTAVSHKVIENMLVEAACAAREAGVALRIAQRSDDDPPPGVERLKSNADALAAVASGAVVGGTAWLWSHEDAVGALDYLVVDEAGQMALACALAAARAARNVILLGDPQQLEQPRRGAHPEGADTAALVHLVGNDHTTIGDAQGLFLDRTWRLHPSICAFTSEVYYENRLLPVSGTERQSLDGTIPFNGYGLFVVDVAHEGNQASAPEEVAAVEQIVRSLLSSGLQWTGRTDAPRRLAADDLLVLAPYNAQVALLRRALMTLSVRRVGTVDKFQGQQAPVVVYSCTSSSPEDAPRGMPFLYDPHRFNVATSRAQGMVIVVASPRLASAACRTPAEMRMVNGLCRFRELATAVAIGASS